MRRFANEEQARVSRLLGWASGVVAAVPPLLGARGPTMVALLLIGIVTIYLFAFRFARSAVLVDKEHVVVKNPFARPRRLDWDDVDRFDIATPMGFPKAILVPKSGNPIPLWGLQAGTGLTSFSKADLREVVDELNRLKGTSP